MANREDRQRRGRRVGRNVSGTVHALPKPTVFYVATLVRYVLVEAKTEAEARERGRTALANLHAEMGLHDPVEILVVRPATSDEIEFSRWNEETLAREQMGRRV